MPRRQLDPTDPPVFPRVAGFRAALESAAPAQVPRREIVSQIHLR
jgi:hypothetical protein